MTDYTNSRVSELIDEWIHSARDREILRSRLIDGLTHERIAERYGISVSTTRRILHKGITKIAVHLN